jgi:hypothetical protein
MNKRESGICKREPLRECMRMKITVDFLYLTHFLFHSTASGCFREAAAVATEIGDYKKGLERWEQVAQMSLESNLTRYSVKDYYLNA